MLKPKRLLVTTAAAAIALAATAPQASALSQSDGSSDGSSVCGPVASTAAGSGPSDCSIQVLGGVLGSGSHSHGVRQATSGNGGSADGTSVCGPLASTAASAESDCSIQILGGVLGSGSHSTS